MGLLSKVFGGSSQKSESGNHAWNEIKDTYYPQAQQGVQAFNAFGNLLGIGGDAESQHAAYNNFLDNSGYDWIMDDAMQGVTNSAAGKFLLRSGSTAKGLQDRAVNIGKTFFDNYLDRVGQMSQMGMGAGGLMTNAGQYSKSSGESSSGGLGKAIGAGLSIFAGSDEALKENVVTVGALEDGLPVVEFDYRQDMGFEQPKGRFRGVMAQDVAKLRPWALGPKMNGYMTVNYGAL